MAQLHVGTMIGIFFFLVKQSHNGIASKRPIIKDSRYIYENIYCRVQYINDGGQ